MVNVTTRRMHSDLTTILDVGDHPFIRKQSVVHYADARHFPVGALDRAVKSGECRPHKQASAALLARIQEGIEFEEAGLI